MVKKFRLLMKLKNKFNRLTPIRFIKKLKSVPIWLFKCDCGNEKEIRLYDVKNEKTKSCGCLSSEINRKRLTKHGVTCLPNKFYKLCFYKTIVGIFNRCYNTNYHEYENYGGKGIKVCDEWKQNPIRLHEWLIENNYKKGLQIDRYPDKNGDYSPENCRVVTPKKNSNNKNNNTLLTFNNTTQSVSLWADELNIKVNTLLSRLRLGWSIEKTLTYPVKTRK